MIEEIGPTSEIIDTALGRARVTHFDSHEEGEAYARERAVYRQVQRELRAAQASGLAALVGYQPRKPSLLKRLRTFLDNKINGYGKGES